MPSSIRQFLPHTRGRFIRPVGMGMSQGFRRAVLPIKATHGVVSKSLGITKGRGTLLLQDDLGATDLQGTGMKCGCRGGMCGCSRGSGFGVKPHNPRLVEKLQSLSLKSVQGITPKRKNVGAVL